MEVVFKINGKLFKISPATVPIETNLVTFIREYAGLKGTKFMCLEGGCGACMVTVRDVHPVTGKLMTYGINSCLQNIYSCHNLDIITVEGLGSKSTGLHQIQHRLAIFNGTQCGFCSPGMVMNMHSLMESKNGKVTMKEVENSLGGNICRCTGYRPILDAFKSLAVDADENLCNAVKDIEDLNNIKTCPKTGTPCSGSCGKFSSEKKSLDFEFSNNKKWYKVFNVGEIFEIFKKVKEQPYMLVAGNTAHGVYRRSHDLQIFIDVTSVSTLRFSNLSDSLEIGGNVTISEAIEIFKEAVEKDENFKYLGEVAEHFQTIGNPAIRNSGTIAGNLIMKHSQRSFSSDVFLLFEAIGAKIVLNDGKNKIELRMEEFLDVDMKKKIIEKIVISRKDCENLCFKCYKVTPRAQNAVSYVNAAFLLKFKQETVESSSVCFGGINDKMTHAKNLEKFIVKKNIFSNETLQEALKTLNEEVVPVHRYTDASTDYRKKLAVALFYKFVLNTCPKKHINPLFLSGSEAIEREISFGIQEFDTHKKDWPLKKRIPKIEADIQCTGEAQYINDMPKQANELYGAFVLSTIAQGKILKFDPSEALKIPGVYQFFTAKDIPGENNFMPIRKSFAFNFSKEEIICSGEVLYHGQPIGIIVADTFELANYAAEVVKVEYEISKDPIYPTVKDVYKANAKERLFDATKYFVNASEYGKNVKHKFQGHFEIPSTQYHFHMETQQCVCVPTEDGMDVHSSTQWMDNVQVAISEMLKVPANSLNLYVRRLGGAFGAKISRPSQIACAAALACHLTKRPVRFPLSLEANMKAIGKRFSTIADYEVEVDENGQIQRLKNHYIQDLGCNLNEPVQFNTTPFSRNCYETKTWDITTQSALTNSASTTWMRAPGTTDAIAMTEHIMEHIAKEVKKDPVDVRIANLTEDSVFHEMIPMFEKDIEFRKRKAEIDKFNQENRFVKRGISIVPMKYYMFYDRCIHGIVSIYQADGSVAISHGGIEMGQGLNTKAIQMASLVMGLPMEKFSIKPSNSLISPNDAGTVASVTSEMVCYVVKNACDILMDRLKPIRERNPNASWEEIVETAFIENVDLSATYTGKEPELKPYYVYGLSCAEVEIDVLTGALLLKRVDILEDTGESLSPGLDIGQIEGGFIMGLGIWLSENLVYHPETGELLTARSWNYKVPGAKDIPVDFRIKLLQKTHNPYFVLRSKGTGEPPVTMACVVAFAIRYAIDSARKDNGFEDTWYDLEPPMTPDKIFSAIHSSIESYKIK